MHTATRCAIDECIDQCGTSLCALSLLRVMNVQAANQLVMTVPMSTLTLGAAIIGTAIAIASITVFASTSPEFQVVG